MKINNTKETKNPLITSVTIAAVTLALVTATVAVVFVSMMMIPIQTAHAKCVSGPKGSACSGSQGTASCSASAGCLIIPESGTSASVSIDSKGLHRSCSSGQGSTSFNAGHPTASSGKGC